MLHELDGVYIVQFLKVLLCLNMVVLLDDAAYILQYNLISMC